MFSRANDSWKRAFAVQHIYVNVERKLKINASNFQVSSNPDKKKITKLPLIKVLH